MPTKRRRLGDLYVVGRPFTVADNEGPIEVWLQKINPLERDKAVRAASAARARTLAFLDDKDSDEYQATVSDVIDFYSDRESLTTLAINNDLMKAKTRAEAEVAGSDKWTKDGLLIGLIDAWQDELAAKYAEDPKDKDAKKVFDKLEEFDRDVREIVDAERLRLERDCASQTISELRAIGAEKLMEMNASNVFIEEFEIQRLLYAVREIDDHSTYYFTDRNEVKSLDDKVREQLSEAYSQLEVDILEGKDSPETDDSSPSSEQSGTEDQAQDSGQAVA